MAQYSEDVDTAEIQEDQGGDKIDVRRKQNRLAARKSRQRRKERHIEMEEQGKQLRVEYERLHAELMELQGQLQHASVESKLLFDTAVQKGLECEAKAALQQVCPVHDSAFLEGPCLGGGLLNGKQEANGHVGVVAAKLPEVVQVSGSRGSTLQVSDITNEHLVKTHHSGVLSGVPAPLGQRTSDAPPLQAPATVALSEGDLQPGSPKGAPPVSPPSQPIELGLSMDFTADLAHYQDVANIAKDLSLNVPLDFGGFVRQYSWMVASEAEEAKLQVPWSGFPEPEQPPPVPATLTTPGALPRPGGADVSPATANPPLYGVAGGAPVQPPPVHATLMPPTLPIGLQATAPVSNGAVLPAPQPPPMTAFPPPPMTQMMGPGAPGGMAPFPPIPPQPPGYAHGGAASLDPQHLHFMWQQYFAYCAWCHHCYSQQAATQVGGVAPGGMQATAPSEGQLPPAMEAGGLTASPFSAVAGNLGPATYPFQVPQQQQPLQPQVLLPQQADVVGGTADGGLQ